MSDDKPLKLSEQTNTGESPDVPGYLPKTDARRRCVQCGCVMRPHVLKDSRTEPVSGTRTDGSRYSATRYIWTVVRILGYGYEGNGVFCSLRCGFQYGKRQYAMIAAENGLHPPKGE